jgi:hypothetical protein
MPVRLGVELTAVSCRYVVLDASPASVHGVSPTRIRAFGRLPREGAQARNELARFRRQPATAVVWGLQADHRHAVVPHGSFRRMRRDAVAEMQGAGVETRGRVADIFAARRAKGAPTRSVVVALASTPGLVSATRWLSAQGVRVQSIVTPALALMSLARLRREFTAPDRVETYVALEETTTAVALVRNGLLLAASELSWGYQDRRGMTLPREEIAGRLADEIERFLAARSARPDVLAQVCICGGLPELRSMAIRLMEQLDVEVETLDSLFGIDPVHLPQPPHEFREHATDMRLAWAVAADWPAPVNLLRERKRRVTKTMLSRAAVAAGVATGVGVAWQVQQSDWWRSAPVSQPVPLRTASRAAAAAPVLTPVPARVTSASAAARPVPAPQPAGPSVAHVPPSPPPQAREVQPLARASGPGAASAEVRQPSVQPPVIVPPPVAPPSPPAPAVARSAVVQPPSVMRSPAAAPPGTPSPVVPPPVARLPVAPPPIPPKPVERSSVASSVVPPRPVRRAVQTSAGESGETVSPPQAEREALSYRMPASEIALPFDAVLGTILYAPERKLAIVDGRIVQTGDDINGARVVEITPTTVLLRDARGRLRRLGLGGPAR